MKRIISLLLVGIMAFVLTACSNMISNGETTTINSTENEETISSEQLEEGEGTEMEQTSSKVLVAYFSNTGTTKNMAENAAEILNGDLFEIVAESPYTSEDLNYNNSSSRANIEQNDTSARPEIASNVDNMSDYNIVVIGYPIWHGQAPRIISTFLESYDFSDKTIIPFCTSHSSGIGNSDKALHELSSDKTNWVDGERFAADSSKESMQEWLNGMNLQFHT